MAKPRTGVHSGMVRTVLGPIPVESMGVTLMHEHVVARHFELVEAALLRKRHRLSGTAARHLDDRRFANEPVPQSRQLRAARRRRPPIEELGHFVEYGGRTVVDPTNLGIGRDPSALQRVSPRTGLNIVMGAGFYLEASHPDYVKRMSVEAIAEAIAADCGVCEDEPEVCAGIIGEIGVSKDFTPRRRRYCAARHAPRG